MKELLCPLLRCLVIAACLWFCPSDFGRADPGITTNNDDVFGCTIQVLERLGDQTTNLDVFDHASLICSKILYWNFLVHDFELRREKFAQQNSDDRVLLWMVVSITIGGVVLSAMQLYGSFRLATSGKGSLADPPSEVSLEKGRLAVKSSVTGLLILTTSFAFFLVFVLFVYQFKDDKVSYPEQPAALGANLGGGALGPTTERPSTK